VTPTQPAVSGRRPKPKPRPKKRKFSDPARSYAKRLERYRPGLVAFTLDGLAQTYGRPTWERRLDPTSELILTILTQNSADINAEVAFEALRHAYPGIGQAEAHNPGAGWGGVGLPDGVAPDWSAVEFAPLPELTDVIRPGGLANQKAPRLQATLRRIREERGDYSLEFLGEDSIRAPALLLRIAAAADRSPRGSRHASRRPAAPEGVDGRRPRPGPRPVRTRPDVRGARQPDPARPQGLPLATPGPRDLSAARPLPVRGPQGALIRRLPNRIP